MRLIEQINGRDGNGYIANEKKPIKPKINIPNQFKALAVLLFNLSIPPTAIIDSGIVKGIRFVWFGCPVIDIVMNNTIHKIIF